MISEAVAYEVTRLLHDNITEGTGTAAYTGCPGQAGKTGTTDRETDAWFAGYQPNLATRGLGRLPAVQRDRNDQRARDHRLRRHLPGRNLALALLGRRSPLRGIRQAEDADQLGALLRPVHRRRAAAAAAASTAPRAGEAERARELGEEATGGYNPDAYAPGAGQKPTPLPPPPPPSARSRRRRRRGRSRERVAEPRAGGGLRPDLGRLPRLPRRPGAGRRGSGGAWSGARSSLLRRRLRLPAAAALPRRLQLRRLRPPRRPARPRPLPPRAGRGAGATRPSPTSPGPTRPAPTARSSPSPPTRSPGCRSAPPSTSSRRSRPPRSWRPPPWSPASPPPAASTRSAPPPSSPSTPWSSSTWSAAPTTTASRSC